MGGSISVDYEGLELAVKEMRAAYEDYSSFTQDAFQTEINHLEGMNSDFIDKLIRVLEISRKWDAGNIKENILDHVREAERIYEEIRAADEAVSGTLAAGTGE